MKISAAAQCKSVDVLTIAQEVKGKLNSLLEVDIQNAVKEYLMKSGTRIYIKYRHDSSLADQRKRYLNRCEKGEFLALSAVFILKLY